MQLQCENHKFSKIVGIVVQCQGCGRILTIKADMLADKLKGYSL